ncbi:hypothetical protein bplSymb_SCF00607P001 [Bathymodiolus platifrons methanotrophic gill symbiont]|nr:hypothetical protein bplSymb_SCF00607P001 [Bathymodiolus platifrons methanotrophic gill symbiont]
MAKAFFLCKEGAHYTFSYYPEVSGWHIFQTYGPSDTVMEIYHNGESIVNEGKSDGDDQARHATSRNSGTPVAIIRSPTQRIGDAPAALRPPQTEHKAAQSWLPQMALRLFGIKF